MFVEQHPTNVWIEAIIIEWLEGRRPAVTLKQHGVEGRVLAFAVEPRLEFFVCHL